MARGGIYKSEVVRARDKLLAMGRYPSVDAVRQELGNTGSKTTIQRYLKEIDEEEGGKTSGKVAISEALQDLVARLAERLNMDAEVRVTELSAKHASELTQQRQAHEAIEAEAAILRKALEQAQTDLANEQSRHQQTTERLQHEITSHAIASQQVVDLEDRLRAEEGHRRSLEEKHTHAREALEHFRAATKEQREQDHRQHEQQVQYLQGEARTLNQALAEKQHEAIHLNQENARLVGEVGRAEAELHRAQGEVRALKDVKERLAASERAAEDLRRQVARQNAQVEELTAGRDEAVRDARTQAQRVNELEVELAAAKAARTAQDELAASISGYLSTMAGRAEKAAKSGAKGQSGHAT